MAKSATPCKLTSNEKDPRWYCHQTAAEPSGSASCDEPILRRALALQLVVNINIIIIITIRESRFRMGPKPHFS